jgi:chemotaxis protein CheD
MTIYQAYYLYPANLFADRQPYKISTLLGSCVAVCLYDTRLKYGGMNHFMLPLWNGEGLASPKYGNVAITQLLTKMIQLGSRSETLVAKVFGGAAVLEMTNNSFAIGERNVEVAMQELGRLGIEVVAQSTGGVLGRKIIFDNQTGDVYQKYVKKSNLRK